ncbi:Dolichylphosphate beta-glucosyltransferase [Pelomyxa schiedti]|nr:Dolichylphosphate beta-glucosyltransferase [Pelomyxa schiedti]
MSCGCIVCGSGDDDDGGCISARPISPVCPAAYGRYAPAAVPSTAMAVCFSPDFDVDIDAPQTQPIMAVDTAVASATQGAAVSGVGDVGGRAAAAAAVVGCAGGWWSVAGAVVTPVVVVLVLVWLLAPPPSSYQRPNLRAFRPTRKTPAVTSSGAGARRNFFGANVWLPGENHFLDPKDGTKHSFPSILLLPPFSPPTPMIEPLGRSVYLSVIIVAFNAQTRLPDLLKDTLSYLHSRVEIDPSFTYEIIVVDDGSRDETSECAHSFMSSSFNSPSSASQTATQFATPPTSLLGSGVTALMTATSSASMSSSSPSVTPSHNQAFNTFRVLKLMAHRGIGGALKRGLLCCRGDIILVIDSAGNYNFSDVVALEAKMTPFLMPGSARSYAAVAFGIPKTKRLQPPGRFNTCGLCIFTREAVQLLIPNQHIEGGACVVELAYIAGKIGVPIFEVPLQCLEVSLTPLTVAIKMVWDLIRIRLMYTFRLWKIVV